MFPIIIEFPSHKLSLKLREKFNGYQCTVSIINTFNKLKFWNIRPLYS